MVRYNAQRASSWVEYNNAAIPFLYKCFSPTCYVQFCLVASLVDYPTTIVRWSFAINGKHNYFDILSRVSQVAFVSQLGLLTGKYILFLLPGTCTYI